MVPRTRTARKASERSRLPQSSGLLWAGVAVAVLVGLGLLGGGIWGLTRAADAPSPVPAATATAAPVASVPVTPAAATSSTVEVPSVKGLSLEDAEMVLGAAGFAVQVVEAGEATAAADAPKVTGQKPDSGELVAEGVTVVLTVPPVEDEPSVAKEAAPTTSKYVVCIDPGHQAHGDSSPEPIGPGAKKTKPSVTGGATGVATRIPEYELNLQIAMNLKASLEARGVRVVMTRTTNDVNLSNSQRAAVANKANADLFVRVHCDGSPDSATAGISTLYPAANSWTKPITAPSKRAAKLVQSNAVASTGAVNRGIAARTDLSGFNYAKVPAVLIEAGFVSNPVEDKLLASPHYQDKVASGIADGIMAFLEGEN